MKRSSIAKITIYPKQDSFLQMNVIIAEGECKGGEIRNGETFNMRSAIGTMSLSNGKERNRKEGSGTGHNFRNVGLYRSCHRGTASNLG